MLNAQISPSAGFVLEAVLTFFLVWVVFATAADPRGAFTVIAGFAIGLTIAADILIGGPLTGAAMNPGRALGPMLVQNQWADGWIWFIGPFLGGALAALAYEMLYLSPDLAPAAARNAGLRRRRAAHPGLDALAQPRGEHGDRLGQPSG